MCILCSESSLVSHPQVIARALTQCRTTTLPGRKSERGPHMKERGMEQPFSPSLVIEYTGRSANGDFVKTGTRTQPGNEEQSCRLLQTDVFQDTAGLVQYSTKAELGDNAEWPRCGTAS